MSNPFFHRLFRRGVSLIELMIVIAIIAVLIALVIPAIQSVRLAAKKVQNQNNIRQIILAFQSYASEHDGQLPPTNGGWPGDGCCPNLNPNCYINYSWSLDGQTATCTTCPNWNVVQSKITYAANPPVTSNIYQTAINDNWTEGTPHFMILPYLGEQAIYVQSYGPMTSGQKYREPDVGSCNCISWDDNSNCIDYVCNSGSGASVTIDQTTPSSINKGYQGGRVPSRVKTFVGYGDPTSDYPGMLAPLSYPMFPVSGSIEQYNSSYQALITEAYSGCVTINPWNSWLPNWQTGMGFGENSSTFDNPNDPTVTLFNTYNSWAASAYINFDTSPQPMVPGYSYVSGGTASVQKTMLIYTGQTSANPKCQNKIVGCCPFDTCPYNPDQLVADPTYPRGIVNPGGQAMDGSSGNTTLWHVPVSPRTFDMKSRDPAMCNTPSFNNDPMCHVGEWYYNYNYSIINHDYFLDHPSPTGCTSGPPMSMTPGSLNVGMLDGSVRGISKNVSREAWFSLVSGQASTSDSDNW